MNQFEDAPFREVQRFHQMWMWLLVVLLSLLPVFIFSYALVEQTVLGRSWGDNPVSDTTLIVMSVLFISLGFFLLWLFYSSRLTVEVNREGVLIRFFPYQLRTHKIPIKDVKGYEIVDIYPIKDYGGLGIRYKKGEQAYIVGGGGGVKIKLQDGKIKTFSSKRAEEFALALENSIARKKWDKSPLNKS